jgi:signal transduction histidine kinase
VSVIDTGPGIAPEDQGKLFQKFSQLETGHTREHTGTGLGLAISKELATLLQAEIQLVSDTGRGSMFSLILPLKFDKSRAQEQMLESGFRGALSPAKAWVAQAG